MLISKHGFLNSLIQSTMFASNLILNVLVVYTLLVILQSEGKHFVLKSIRRKPNKKDHRAHISDRQHLKNLQRSRSNHTESGKRRQYLTAAGDQITATNSFQQDQNSLSPLIAQDNAVPSPGIINSLQSDNSVNLPLAGTNVVRQPVPIETEKPVPVPFAKPDIRLAPKLFPLPYAKKPDLNVAHLHIEQGVNPCQNGGLVVQSPGGYSCLCRKEYRGKHCQEKDLCFPNPCQNGGNCIDRVTHLQCACAKGFKGLRCQESDSCDKNPCQHGGTCLDLKTGLQCVCAVGYKGPYCNEVDFCNPNPCRNGGTCTEKNMAAVCLCKNEYKGTRCEAEKVCDPNPCRNNGQCNEGRSSAPCDCAQGFTGKYCTDHVCKPSPCLNGGVCSFQKSVISSTWLPICKCPDKFKGEKCEIPNPCAGKPSPCQHGVCFDAFNARHMDIIADHFVCNCYRGYMGPKCDVRSCDKCDTHAKCQNQECVCDDGYYGNGHSCKKLPDPCIPNPCENFGICVPFKSSFDCRCPFSFVGERCEQQL